jgi:D-lactate dehydrogenase
MTFEQALKNILPEDRIKMKAIERYAYASDASHFFMVPSSVVQPQSVEEIQKLFVWAEQYKMPLTFRTGGTSLSGQSCTQHVLVDLSRYWRKAQPENNGEQIRVEPSVLGSSVNLALKKYGRKMGPDPASINAAMMGGIVSNNSSGMCCGVAQNSYHTIRHIKFVLPDGLVYNTEDNRDYDRFMTESKELAEGLQSMRKSIIDNPAIHEKIRQKYQQKNTTGYGLNAFIDYEHPLDIFAHLLIGAEGTLAFIAEMVMDTIPDYPHKITGMLYFENPEAAGNAIEDLKKTNAKALEFMDRSSLRSVEDVAGVPEILKTLPPQAAAILVEFQAETEAKVNELYQQSLAIFDKCQLVVAPQFTSNPYEQEVLWKIRKGLYPSVAGIRAQKTSTMLEDLTFPTERLGEAIMDIQRLFEKYGYKDAIIFGHAKDGNLHFCLAQDFSKQEEIDRFIQLNDEIFDLVLNKYDGALKAEHGTGRAVAPYVEAEWGSEAYGIMKKLKQLVDPHNILNPDVIIPEDKNVHLKDLKWMPIVEEEVDKCVECGFCERRCPSRDYTMTPRQRISVRRSMQRLNQQGDKATYNAILKDYQHYAMDTCAVDGMCATDCPVSINTGELIKRLRKENHSPFANRLALKVAKNFNAVERTASFSVGLAHKFNSVFGNKFMTRLTATARKVSNDIPLWSNQISKPASIKALTPHTSEKTAIVYFSTCISRMMGGDIFKTFQSVCTKAGVGIIIPDEMNGTCCGQLFSSKGFKDAYVFTANETLEKIWKASKQGQYPIVLDGTSCTYTFKNSRSSLRPENQQRFDQLTILDTIDFASDVLLPNLNIKQKKKAIVFHPVCAGTKLNLQGKLQKIGNACAHKADIPAMAACCGMAGDRGFYFPDLTQAATKLEAAEVSMIAYDGYYSSGKTCEMAMSDAVGKDYESVLKLLDEVT